MLNNKKFILSAFFMLTAYVSGAQTNHMAEVIQNYKTDKQLLAGFYTVAFSPESRLRFRALTNEYLEKLEEQDFNKFTTGERVDYLLLKRDLNETLFDLDKDEKQIIKLNKLFPFAPQIYALEKQSRRGTSVEGKTVATQLNGINTELRTLITGLEKQPKFDVATALFATAINDDLISANKKAYDFYNEYDPLYSWWVPATYKQTDSLLKVYSLALSKNTLVPRNDVAGARDLTGIPVGREEIIRKLNIEMIPYSPEELVDMATKELAWCDQEMLKATAEMGLKDDWKAAMEKVKNTYVEPGKQPELIVKLYNDAMTFIKSRDLITIPALAEETWGMIMMTPERQLVNPFFTGGSEISVTYPTTGMEYDDKMMSMRGNNPYFSRGTVQHELIPGHNLQYFMKSHYNTHRDFNTPFWMEGWALYWELLLYDMKFAKTPEEKIGMLFWRKHRCARIIFSLNYQLGKWSPQQCVDFLVDRVGHERANAEGEVRRSIAPWTDPLYQVGYLTGGLQIWSLKKELVDGGKMSIKQFHDAFIKENSMPIEMIRAILMNESLSKDFKTKWRFYDLKK
jgi:hypothetical protein